MPLQSFLCELFTSEDHDLPTRPKPSTFNSRQRTVKFPLFYPAKTPKGVLLIERVLGEGLYSPGDQAMLFRWGWVCLSLTQPMLQLECGWVIGNDPIAATLEIGLSELYRYRQ